MAGILETLYPQGDYLNIKANAPTRRDYNIQVNADLARNLPGGLLKDIVAPAAAATLSLPYDAIQAYQRMQRGTGIKGYYDAFMAENPFSSLGQRFVGASAPLAERLANLNLSNTLSNLAFTPAYGDIPTKEERQGIESFDNLVSDTVIAQPRSQFQDYPGDKNLGSVQDQNLGFDYNFDENVLKEEEDAQYNLDNKGSFNFDGMLQNLGGYAKDAAGRYIGLEALGGAGTMIGGPVVGGIAALAGLLGGRDLFNSPYIGAGAYTMDQYGNMYTADQLNKMNARGGYYTEQARDSRRRDQEIRNMIERKNQGLKFGINRLAQLKELQRQEEVSRQSAVDDYFGGSDAGADKGRFDGAPSRSEYDANPTGYSGPF
jgi:hypothetical protein